MVTPAVDGIDLFKIAGRSISGWVKSFKMGTAAPVKQPFCSFILWLEYLPQVKSYARGDIGSQVAHTCRLPISKYAPFAIGYTFEGVKDIMTQDSQAIAAEYRGYAEAFQDQSVVEAYQYRPPYPDSTFEILTQLLPPHCTTILDVGCGRGELARHLAQRVERVDAVDVSRAMIEQGKQLPYGNHPRLRWLQGRIEEVQLQPPYALVTAGASLHWMDWKIVMPRFAELLIDGAYLAEVGGAIIPGPWTLLGEMLSRYRTDRYIAQPHDVQEQRLFQVVGERMTEAISFVQSVDDVVESYHSRVGFSRERMGSVQATAFDREAKEILLKAYPSGMVPFQVRGHVVWGLPKKKE